MLERARHSALSRRKRATRAILPQLLAHTFTANCAVIRVLSAKDGDVSALADFALQAYPADRLTDKVSLVHAANLIVAPERGKRRHARYTSGVPMHITSPGGSVGRMPSDRATHRCADRWRRGPTRVAGSGLPPQSRLRAQLDVS
jgi:hypothetical protein